MVTSSWGMAVNLLWLCSHCAQGIPLMPPHPHPDYPQVVVDDYLACRKSTKTNGFYQVSARLLVLWPRTACLGGKDCCSMCFNVLTFTRVCGFVQIGSECCDDSPFLPMIEKAYASLHRPQSCHVGHLHRMRAYASCHGT